MHMLDSRDCENHEHFLWLCKGKLAAQNVVAFPLKSTISHGIFGESNVQTRYDHPDRCLFIFMFPLACEPCVFAPFSHLTNIFKHLVKLE